MPPVVEIPQDLVEEFARGRGVLFIGAGLSMGAGLPGWRELMETLANEIHCPKDDLLRIPQYYEQYYSSREKLIERLRSLLDRPGAKPTENHYLLIQLPVRVIFTTNYDNLLEKTLDERAIPYHPIVSDKAIGSWDEEERLQLIKMHGSLEIPESIVITKQDYQRYFGKHPNIARQLSALLMTRTFLFLGFGLTDPNFNLIYDHIWQDLEQFKRPAYAVLLNGDPFAIRDYESRGLKVINVPVGAGENPSTKLREEVLLPLVELVNQQRDQYSQYAPYPIGGKLSVEVDFEAQTWEMITTMADALVILDAKHWEVPRLIKTLRAGIKHALSEEEMCLYESEIWTKTIIAVKHLTSINVSSQDRGAVDLYRRICKWTAWIFDRAANELRKRGNDKGAALLFEQRKRLLNISPKVGEWNNVT